MKKPSGTQLPQRMAYVPGWLEHTQAYSEALLMTELGLDGLAETEVGFHGSALLPERLGFTASWWGTETWHLYPLAPKIVRDKVLFYQHDLAPETFTTDKATLTWNLAFGSMLSYDLVASAFSGGVDSEWLSLVSAFQRHALADYADEGVTDLTYLEDDVTQTSFEHHPVVANWDEANTYTVGEHTLAASGVLLASEHGDLTAGMFMRFGDAPLSAGDHYLIERRGGMDVRVYQPIGADTKLTVDLLTGWTPDGEIAVWAYNADDYVIGAVPVTFTAQDITFSYRQRLAGQSVGYYRILRPAPVFAAAPKMSEVG